MALCLAERVINDMIFNTEKKIHNEEQGMMQEKVAVRRLIFHGLNGGWIDKLPASARTLKCLPSVKLSL